MCLLSFFEITIDKEGEEVYSNCITWNGTVGTDETVKKGGDILITINPKSNQPIFEQIVMQIKMAVLKGYLKQGDSIPSVRKLALSLSVTPGTVAKAYSELEHQNVIVTIRGKGAYIAEQCDNEPTKAQKERGFAVFRDSCMELIYLGIEKKEIVKEIDKIFDTIVM